MKEVDVPGLLGRHLGQYDDVLAIELQAFCQQVADCIRAERMVAGLLQKSLGVRLRILVQHTVGEDGVFTRRHQIAVLQQEWDVLRMQPLFGNRIEAHIGRRRLDRDVLAVVPLRARRVLGEELHHVGGAVRVMHKGRMEVAHPDEVRVGVAAAGPGIANADFAQLRPQQRFQALQHGRTDVRKQLMDDHAAQPRIV